MLAEILATMIRLLTGVQSRWRGCEPGPTQRVYFANHTSNLDFPVIWAVLPEEARRYTLPVAAKDYWSGGKIRQYLAERVFFAVLIERQRVTKTNNPIRQLIPILTAGYSLIIFPEGGRTSEIASKPFKSGLYHLAKAMPTVEFIPVYIDNANRVLPKGEILPIPLVCSVNFGAPLQVWPGETRDSFLNRARSAVLSLGKA